MDVSQLTPVTVFVVSVWTSTATTPQKHWELGAVFSSFAYAEAWARSRTDIESYVIDACVVDAKRSN